MNAPANPKPGSTRKVLLVVVAAAVLFLLLVILPGVHQAREAARRTTCKCRLKQLGLAFHNYHEVYGAFPPAYTVDADGKPLHSWRTLLLPYLDQAPLYSQIDLSKPWDDPANAAAFETPMPVYGCPSSSTAPVQASFLAVVLPNSILRAGQSLKTNDVSDGTSNTILVIEVPHDQAVPWMSPRDADAALLAQFTTNSKESHTGGRHALLGDGMVRFLSQKIAPTTLQALFTATGGEKVGEF